MTDVLQRTDRFDDAAASPEAFRAVLPCQEIEAADLFFSECPADLESAKQLCTGCPLRQECLDGALARREPWGVWGGSILSDGEIIAVKRGRGRPRKNAA